ncbi:MAG: ABC transporter ATP-binding protein [Streptosporangiaceae bacterium]
MTAVVESLTVGVGATGPLIIQDISCRIETGQIVGLVGESGSGKTTLATAMLGYLRDGAQVRSGRVVVDGHDITAAGRQELNRIRGRVVSYVSSDPGSALNPVRRIGAQLREMTPGGKGASAGTARAGDDLIAQTLHSVGLPSGREFLRRFPHQLSGGQQQRVMLAFAFLRDPGLVVLDEPTSALDAITQRSVLDVVRAMCTEHGTAALLISHDIEVISSVGDAVIVLYGGRVAESGPVEQVLQAPSHRYTNALLTAVPTAEVGAQVSGIRGRAPRLEERAVGCFFAPRCDFAGNPCHEKTPQLVNLQAVGHIGVPHLSACFFPRADGVDPMHPSAAANNERLDVGETEAPALEARNLTVSYGARTVLQDISFRLVPGECLAVVGESGSGKSTLAHALVGLRAPNGGTIELADGQLAGLAAQRTTEQRRQIQYVFQNPYASLNPRRTIRQILREPVRAFDLDAPDLAGALDRVSLSQSVLDERPAALSGGERQRVAIARALLVQPSFLICDEVTSALDVSVQATVVRLLGELREELGLGLLFITHNLKLVASIADRVMVMRDGLVTNVGSTSEVFTGGADEYTSILLTDASIRSDT